MKLSPRDLQIGDFVLTRNDFPMRVTSLFQDSTVYLDFEGNEGDVWEENLADIKPIPLTETMLTKLGFAQSKIAEGLHRYNKDKPEKHRKNKGEEKYSLWWIAQKNPLKSGPQMYANQYSRPINYLHQLQQDWAQQTGQELNIPADALFVK